MLAGAGNRLLYFAGSLSRGRVRENAVNDSRRGLPRPTAAEWIVLGVGLFLVLHYAWLLDDAYVYFRYVDNWVLLDRGLVYNPGEYTEGYTSPAWLLLLSALRAAGLGFWLAVRLVALLSFLGFWLLALRIDRELAPGEAAGINLPLVFLTFNYAVLCYFTSGTESPLVQLAAGVFVLFALRPTWGPATWLIPLLPLVRPELTLALVAALGWYRLKTGRVPWTMAALALLVGGGWLLFRIVYYAELFPTTFYLKNIRDVSQGIRFVHDTLGPYHLYALFALGGVGLAWASRREEPERLSLDGRILVALVALALVAYVVKVGGDGRHYRYLAFPICASLLALGGLAERGLARIPVGARGWAAAALAAGVATLSFTSIPRQLTAHPAFFPRAKVRQVDKIADAAHHRFHRDQVSPSPWSSGETIELRPRYRAWRIAGGDPTPMPIHRDGICYRQYLKFDHWAIQAYGLTDGVLARVEMDPDRPAHKEGLRPLARDLGQVMRWWDRPPDRGMYRAAVEAGVAAPWIADHLPTLELLERKIYNRHDPAENLVLALHVGERIELETGR
jgi:hypothetical protein